MHGILLTILSYLNAGEKSLLHPAIHAPPLWAPLQKQISRFIVNLVKSRSHEIGNSNYRIALTFDRHIGRSAACQMSKRWELLIQISRLRDFARSYNKTSHRILKQGPSYTCTYVKYTCVPDTVPINPPGFLVPLFPFCTL